MYMKASKEKQRKEKNDEMVSFRRFLVCLFLFLFQFSQVMSHSTYNAMSVRSGAHN